jgi:pyruvate dehydrogenase E2 component (dihydrolipoamide acetyltransferase)
LVGSDSGPVVRDLLPLSLTFDHRVVTGGEAARFLGAVIADLERPD